MTTYSVLIKPLKTNSLATETSSGSQLYATNEDGTQARFYVSLSAQPTFDVAVTFTSSDTSEGMIDTPKLTFTASNWNTPQLLSVTGIQDYDYVYSPAPNADGDVSYIITAAISTLDVNYYRAQIAPMKLINVGDKNELGIDRDIPLQNYATMDYDTTGYPSYGYMGYGDVQGSSNNLLIGMDGADQLYGLDGMDTLLGGIGNDKFYGGYEDDKLYGEAGDDMLFGVEDNDYLSGGAGNDTLDGGWGVDTLVGGVGNDTYVLVYDAVDVIQDNGAATDVDIALVPYNMTSYMLPQNKPASNNSTNYLLHVNNDLSFNFSDDIATLLDGSCTTENGSLVSYSFVLKNQPRADVSITFSSSDTTEGRLDKSTFVFTVDNWNKGQTLVITGVDDPFEDGDVSYSINASVSSKDANYAHYKMNPIALTNVDDELGKPLGIYGDQTGRSTNDILVGTNSDDRLYGKDLIDDLSGGLGDDRLYGGYDDDFLYGDAGNDQLFGEEDSDYMEGGAGNDTLDGGSGNDTMIGGAGNDVYYLYYLGTDTIDDKGLASDIDTVSVPYNMTSYTLPTSIENGILTEGTDPSSLTGNASNNVLTGNDGQNTLNDGAGNDTLSGGLGKDQLTGGTGADVFVFTTANEIKDDVIIDFNANQGDKIDLSGFANQTFSFVTSNVFTAVGQLRYDANTATLYGNTNTDTAPEFSLQLTGVKNLTDAAFVGLSQAAAINHKPTGSVFIIGDFKQGETLIATNNLKDEDGLGNISYRWQADAVNFGNADTVTLTTNEVGKRITVSAAYVDGQGHSESVSSSATSAVIGDTPTLQAAFVVTALNGNSTSEADGQVRYALSLMTAPLRDVTLNFSSSDTSEGVIYGKASFTFTASNWATPQTLSVKGVNDTLDDGNISYRILGTVETIDINYSQVSLRPLDLINNDDGNDMPLTLRGDLNGGHIADVFVGKDGNDLIYGYTNRDDLSGGMGDDTLYGGYENDNLFGGDDNDLLYGEEDNDYLEGNAGNDSLDGGFGVDTMIGGAGNDTYYLSYDASDVIQDNGSPSDVDVVIMPYQLSRYTLPNGIENGAIADGTSNSDLIGNSSNNQLSGNAGNNSLNGSAGNDVLIGGDGSDTLTGGTGKDSFQFTRQDSIDRITDFSPKYDRIQLDDAIFKTFKTSVLNANQFNTGASASDSDDRIIYNKTTGALYYDDDGAGGHAAVQIATLGVKLALNASDFLVV